MAFACAFDEDNMVLNPPDGVPLEICNVLPVCATQSTNGLPLLISCWKLTREELDEVNRTGRIWLEVMGSAMPPVWITGSKPFEETQE